MAWMICGTVPDASFPLTGGRWRLDGGFLHAEGGGIAPLSVQRGTPALLGTALLTCETLGVEPPTALLAGDTGNGDGSRKLYSRLAASPSLSGVRGITFHYLFPDLDGHNRVLMALEEADPKPVLVADAGFMYVAKMSGYADAYDLFTPDAGELAFLADEKAPHPFYTRGFLLAADEDIPSLVERAYQHGNAARFLLIKGKVDHLVEGGRFLGDVSEPQVAALEPIGGTGDLVTGLVTGLLAGGMEMPQACLTAARPAGLPGCLRTRPPRRRSRNCCPSSPKRCAALWRGPPPLCPPPGRETVQTRAAPSLRILTGKAPFLTVGGFLYKTARNHSKPSLWQLPFRKLLSDGFHLPIRPIRSVLTVYRFDLPVSPVRDISRQHLKREYAEQQNQKEFFHCNYPATCSAI